MPFFKSKQTPEEKLIQFRIKADESLASARAKFDSKNVKVPAETVLAIRAKTDAEIIKIRAATDQHDDIKYAVADEQIATNNAERDEAIALNNAEYEAKVAVKDARLAELKAERAEIDAHNSRVWNEFKGEMKTIFREGRERRRQIISNAVL